MYKVESEGFLEPRMQNIAVLANIDKNSLIPHVETKHLHQAMKDLMEGSMLKKNMEIFNKIFHESG